MKNKEYIKLRVILAIVSLYIIGLLFIIGIFFDIPCEIGNIGKECAMAGIVTGIFTLVFIIAFIIIFRRKKRKTFPSFLNPKF